MFVRIEPREFNMYSVFFVFNEQKPDSEDADVKTYLEQHRLEPKRQWDEVWQNVDCHIMYFGGCYIERHMQPIGEMHKRGVQQSLLRQAVDKALAGQPSKAVTAAMASLADGKLDAVKTDLMQKLNVESSFGTDKNGYVVVTVPKATIRREFLALAKSADKS